MANYSRDNRGNRSGGGNRSFDKPRFNRERTEMFSATCANCGKQCEVPFRPTGNKPVLCRECFQNNRGADSRRPEQRSFDRPQFNRDDNQNRNTNVPDYKMQFDMLNAKMDKILDLLTQNPAEVEVAPLESSIDEKVIEEIADEIQEEDKEETVKKTKKTKSAAKAKK
jgi:CxxC-x17-CxxC domain-containing protein